MRSSALTATDQFCGAGGSTIGAIQAGIEIVLAQNHWKRAGETYAHNNQNVRLAIADISASDPRWYPSTDILITSPECTNHSVAKGSKRQMYTKDLFGNILLDPAQERSRATMWDVPRYAEFHNYRIIVVENVVDAAKWRLWDEWLATMRKLDYNHEVVYFNSMFAWPTPQSRDRLYVVFWKKGVPKPNLDFRPQAYCDQCVKIVGAIQTWKKKLKWGRYGAQKSKGQYFYRCPDCTLEVTPFYFAAFNAIDWTIPAERIGDRKKPLQPKTLERVKYGLEKFGRQPLVVTGRYTSGVECRVRPAATEPLPTQPGDPSHYLAFPWMVETAYSHSGDNRVISTLDPNSTQTTRQTVGIVGFLSKQYGGGADPRNMGLGLNDPAGTITTDDHHALLSLPGNAIFSSDQAQADQMRSAFEAPSFIANLHGTSTAWGVDDPLMCIMAGGKHHALLSSKSFLSYYYGQAQASGLFDPIYTVTGTDHAALVGVLDKMQLEDLTFRMLRSHEIGKAMAFPVTYKVFGTEKEKTKQYGNAVTPPVQAMLMESCAEALA